MKLTTGLIGAFAAAEVAAGAHLRNILYFDQYHTTAPPKNVTSGITHVITAFANSSLFIGDTAGTYYPFMNVSDVRPLFDKDTKVGIALGGWGDTDGFSEGAKSSISRATYAKAVAEMLDCNGFDFVDIDWEYPAGNGPNYKKPGYTNAEKVNEITTYPLFLQAIKNAIGSKELSIAVPGRAQDMIAFTKEQAPKIQAAVDFANVMTYDLMNRRDNATFHHTGVQGSLETVQRYLDLGFPPEQLNLGFAFYAKYFETKPDVACTEPVGCPIVVAEDITTGDDLGTSGAVTFETANMVAAAVPSQLTVSTSGSCGVGTPFTCVGYPGGSCCSQYGYCGATSAYCGSGCQSQYGSGCTGPDTSVSWQKALANGKTDTVRGGQWYWDADNQVFWTWDTTDLMKEKFSKIVEAKQLGGVMAWSMGEDSYDWSHIRTMTEGVRNAAARGGCRFENKRPSGV